MYRHISRWRTSMLLPLVGLAAALAIGVHAGEAVKSLTADNSKKPAPVTAAAKKTPPAKSTATAKSAAVVPTRSQIDLAREAQRPPQSAAVSLEEQRRQIALREQLLEASEKRVNAKLAELKSLQQAQTNAATAAGSDLRSPMMGVVKVYETMKPKDAARIFEKLDLNVQLMVASRMKERVVAAMMAEMSPDAAKRLTMEMVAKASYVDSAGRNNAPPRP